MQTKCRSFSERSDLFPSAAALCRARNCNVPSHRRKETSGRRLSAHGTQGSQALAAKFGKAPALGFATDDRNGITVLDIDTSDERVLVRALDRHGHTPLVARTASGKHHAYYRYNGERRRIRPWPGREIDLLARGGMVIAPPSTVARAVMRSSRARWTTFTGCQFSAISICRQEPSRARATDCCGATA